MLSLHVVCVIIDFGVWVEGVACCGMDNGQWVILALCNVCKYGTLLLL